MTRSRWVPVSVAAACAVLVGGVAACGSDSPSPTSDPPAVTVTGTGEVQGTPDTLTATVGVTTRADDVSSAIAQAGSRVQAVTAAVEKAGVDRKDVQTEQVSLQPQYAGSAPGVGPSVTGYEATNTVRITVRDLSRASTVLGAAVDAGGNDARLSGVAFRIDDDSRLLGDARQRAFDDAKTRAEQYAKLSGTSLSRVLSVQENVTGQRQPLSADSSAQASTVPIEPGQQSVTVSVTVKWGLR
ncbi:SIMPL domain-containing protein [Williamsia sp. SKLECPSW1]